jgi:hypothetical protein
VSGLERRLREAARLGYGQAIVPRATARDARVPPGIEAVQVATLREAVERALGPRDRAGRPETPSTVLVAQTNGGD